MSASDPLQPPEPFTLPLIHCPACQHGIDVHGLDPGGPCSLGKENWPCPCLWSPNDVAGYWLREWIAPDAHEAVIATAKVRSQVHITKEIASALRQARDDMLRVRGVPADSTAPRIYDECIRIVKQIGLRL